MSPKPRGSGSARRKAAGAGGPGRGRAFRKPAPAGMAPARVGGTPKPARALSPRKANGAAAVRDTVSALSHIAIATPDANVLAETLALALGAERGEEEMLDQGALRVLFARLGPLTLELLEPRSPDHTVARFLANRGPGLHHVSLEVADIEEALERCRTAGVRLIDEFPRPGAAATRVAFLHPRSLGGVLVELVERPRAAARRRR